MPKLTIHKLGEAIVFRCTGRIVFGECHILRHAVFSHPYIAIAVLDMAEVTAMDAPGLGLLVELRNCASAKRMQVKLLKLTPHLANLLNMGHLTPIFEVCSARERDWPSVSGEPVFARNWVRSPQRQWTQWEQTAKLHTGGEVVFEKTVGEVLWLFNFDPIHHRW
jgi:anti-anti-sigma factor